MVKFNAVLRLTRIEHSIMLVIAVVAAELLAKGFPSITVLLLSLVTPIFVSMGSFAINDYFDIEVDRLNKKDRPLVNGSITKSEARYVIAASFAIGVAASAFINLYAFAIALVFAALAIAYSYRLKEMLLVGNAYVALSMVIPFLYGNYVVSSALAASIVPISAMVFLSGLAREIDGTIRDYAGDVKKRGVRSIPKVMGLRNAAVLAVALYSVAVAISAYLFAYVPPFRASLLYGALVVLSDILLLYTGLGYVRSRSRKFYDLARNISLAALSLAIVAILLAAII